MVDVADARFERPHRFEERLLDRAANGHDLAGSFHLRAEFVRGVGKLVEREAGDFRHHVIQRRLEAGRRIGQPDFVERQADGDFGADAGNGIPRSLRCEGRRTRHARVDLDEVVFERQGVQCELHVAPALDFEFADDFQRRIAQHLILAVGERLARRDDDRVARVDTDGVDVLHVADSQRRIVAVADDLVFDFLVALDAFLDEHLMHGREEQSVAHQLAQFLLVVGETAARAAQRERGTQHDGIPDAGGHLDALLDRSSDFGRQDGLAQRFAQLLEQLTVFGPLDRLERRTENLDLTLVENTLFGQLHGEVQTRLPAETRHDGVGTFVTDDFGNVFERQRLHVDLVGDVRVGHNRGRIGIDQHYLVTLLAKGQTSLRTGVIELGSLSDDDRARPDDHHLVDIFTFRHFYTPPSFE